MNPNPKEYHKRKAETTKILTNRENDKLLEFMRESRENLGHSILPQRHHTKGKSKREFEQSNIIINDMIISDKSGLIMETGAPQTLENLRLVDSNHLERSQVTNHTASVENGS